MLRTALRIALQVLGVAVGSALALWSFYNATNEILFHGFAPSCSDGSPDFDPRYCGIIWKPGLPYVAAFVLALVVLALSVPAPTFRRRLLLWVGGSTAALAVLLLVADSWFPTPPAPPEPVAPQLLMLAVGLGGVLAGVRLGRGQRRTSVAA